MKKASAKRRVLLSVTITAIRYYKTKRGGIDITGSSRVEIDHCFISTADDGIVVKNPADTRTDMSDIYVHDCQVVTVMNSFKIGTETRFDISNVLVENCRFFMPDIYPGTTSGIAIESSDGSHVTDVVVRNIEMDRVTCPIFVCLNMRNRNQIPYSSDQNSPYWGGSIQRVTLGHIVAHHVEVPSLLFGSLNSKAQVRKPIEDIEVVPRSSNTREMIKFYDVNDKII